MILISYDISDNKKRNKFNKYISKFCKRVQYSVYEFDNSNKILDNIIADIKNKFAKGFDQTDSIYIYKIPETAQIIRLGNAVNEEKRVIIV